MHGTHNVKFEKWVFKMSRTALAVCGQLIARGKHLIEITSLSLQKGSICLFQKDLLIFTAHLLPSQYWPKITLAVRVHQTVHFAGINGRFPNDVGPILNYYYYYYF